MLLSTVQPLITYDEVARAVHKFAPLASSRGVWLRVLEYAALEFGVKLVRVRRGKYSIVSDTGLLIVKLGRGERYHTVVLAQGRVICPDPATVWDAACYLQENRAIPLTLLVIDYANAAGRSR